MTTRFRRKTIKEGHRCYFVDGLLVVAAFCLLLGILDKVTT